MTWLFSNNSSIAESIRFATMDFAPYALHDDPGGRRGLFIDIDAAIAARSGLNITESIFPIARVMKNFEHGISDCGIFLLSNWSRANFIPVAEIIGQFKSIIVTRQGLMISKTDDLDGHRLALPRGSYRGFSISTDPNIQRLRTNDYGQSARLLKAGRIDAIAGTALSIYHYLSVTGQNRKDIGGILTFENNPLWLQCTRQKLSMKLIDQLRHAANTLRTDGSIQKLINIYTPVEFK